MSSEQVTAAHPAQTSQCNHCPPGPWGPAGWRGCPGYQEADLTGDWVLRGTMGVSGGQLKEHCCSVVVIIALHSAPGLV